MYRAYISKINNSLRDDLLAGLNWINWKHTIKSDSKIFVKPNFTWPKYRRGVTTNPEVLRELLSILVDRADTVVIGESNIGNVVAEKAFKNHNVYEICKETGAEIVNLSKIEPKLVETKVQGEKIKIELPRLLVNEVDVFVSVPVLKTHVFTTVSLSLKNQWGCIVPSQKRLIYHHRFDHVVVAVNKLLKPKIAVIDATYALNGRGPVFGDPVKMNLIMCSNNLVAADTIGCELIQIPAHEISHLTLAEKEGLGTMNLSRIQMNHEKLNALSRKFMVKKKMLDELAVLTYKSHYLTKVVYYSKLTPTIRKIANSFRPPEEILYESA